MGGNHIRFFLPIFTFLVIGLWKDGIGIARAAQMDLTHGLGIDSQNPLKSIERLVRSANSPYKNRETPEKRRLHARSANPTDNNHPDTPAPSTPYKPPSAPDKKPSAPDNKPSAPYNPPSAPDNKPSAPDNKPSAPYNPPSVPYNPPSAPYNPPSAPYNPPSAPYNPPSAPYYPPPPTPYYPPQPSSYYSPYGYLPPAYGYPSRPYHHKKHHKKRYDCGDSCANYCQTSAPPPPCSSKDNPMNTPCTCTESNFKSGCYLAECTKSSYPGDYICFCTEYNKPANCRKSQCPRSSSYGYTSTGSGAQVVSKQQPASFTQEQASGSSSPEFIAPQEVNPQKTSGGSGGGLLGGGLLGSGLLGDLSGGSLSGIKSSVFGGGGLLGDLSGGSLSGIKSSVLRGGGLLGGSNKGAILDLVEVDSIRNTGNTGLLGNGIGVLGGSNKGAILDLVEVDGIHNTGNTGLLGNGILSVLVGQEALGSTNGIGVLEFPENGIEVLDLDENGNTGVLGLNKGVSGNGILANLVGLKALDNRKNALEVLGLNTNGNTKGIVNEDNDLVDLSILGTADDSANKPATAIQGAQQPQILEIIASSGVSTFPGLFTESFNFGQPNEAVSTIQDSSALLSNPNIAKSVVVDKLSDQQLAMLLAFANRGVA